MITIIIPVYNKENSIRQTIESVLSQTFHDFELLIVNDGSTDNSLEKVYAFEDKRIRIINKKNSGVSAARNTGIKEAMGEYLFFLDADDILLEHCLDILWQLINDYNTKISCANFYLRYKERLKPYSFYGKKSYISNGLKYMYDKKICPRTGATLFHRSLFEDIEYFDENLCRYEDAKLIYNFLRIQPIAYSPEKVLIYCLEYNTLSKYRGNIKKDFIGEIQFENKTFYEKMLLGSLLEEGLRIYPNDFLYLKSKYNNYIIYSYLAKYKSYLVKINYRIHMMMFKIGALLRQV